MADNGHIEKLPEESGLAKAKDGEEVPTPDENQPSSLQVETDGSTPQEKVDEDIKLGFENNKESIDRTRSVIAFRFIIGFFGVVFLVFVTGWSGIFKESTFKDMLLTIVGTLSSSLGFIIGYYFKSSEEKRR